MHFLHTNAYFELLRTVFKKLYSLDSQIRQMKFEFRATILQLKR